MSELDPAMDGAEAASQTDAGWRRLHTLSPIVNLVPQTWRMVRGYWPLIIALLVGSRASPGLGDLGFLAFFFLSAAFHSIIVWATTLYRIHDGNLEIRSGLISRTVRIIGPDRIQNASAVRNPLHRIFGLAEVRIETAGDPTHEGLFSALSEEGAEALLTELEQLRRVHRPPITTRSEGEMILRLGWAEILAHGLSSRRAGAMALVFVVLAELFSQVGPEEARAVTRSLGPRFWTGILLASLALGWLLGVMDSVLRYHNFTLMRFDDRLVAEHGLLTRRRIQLPRGRIQLIQVEEPILRRWMGYATLQVETAGIALGPDGLQAAEATLPMVAHGDLARLGRELLPTLDVNPWLATRGAKGGGLSPAPLRSLAWTQARLCLTMLFITAGFCAAVGMPGLLAALLWFPLSLGAALDWAWQAWQESDRHLVSRRGFWIRRTWILPRDKIQSLLSLQGPVHRLLDLSELLVRMAGSSILLPPMDFDQAQRLLGHVSSTPPKSSPPGYALRAARRNSGAAIQEHP